MREEAEVRPALKESDLLLEKTRMTEESSKSLRIESDDEVTASSEDESSVSKRKLLISIVVIVGVAVCFVAATQFSKYALVMDPSTFSAPFFMLWFSTSWMSACFPAFLIYNRIRGTGVMESFKQSSTVLGGSALSGIGRVLLFLILWSGSNYSYTASLTLVSASVAASISSCNAAFVWLLAMALLGDTFKVPKLLAVLFAVGGVVLISLDGELNAPWLGIVLALVSALLAAVYKVLFKYVLGDATLGQVSLFLSSLGLANLVINFLPMLMMQFFGAEHMEAAKLPWPALLGSAALGLLLNFLINFGIALLHPLVIAVGMLCGIPLNTVVDIISSAVAPSLFFVLGSVSIVLSFVLVVFPYSLIPVCRRIGFA